MTGKQAARVASAVLAMSAVFGVTSAVKATPAAASGSHTATTGCSAGGSRARTRQGKWLGIVRPVSRGSSTPCTSSATGAATGPASYYRAKYRGTPPLLNHAGPVMGTPGSPGSVTVTPIYWDPSGALASSYKNVINGFIANAASDSGKPTNVFAVDLQYGIGYSMRAGTPIVDTDAFPADGCTPDSGAIYSNSTGYTTCLTDAQIQAEVEAATAARSLPSDLSHLYIVFLPQGVESCFTSSDGAQGGGCTINYSDPQLGFCGYHSSVSYDNPSSASPPIYADMPFPIYNSPIGWTCSPQYGPGNQSPNGQLDADIELDTVSHEMNEAITDPQGTAWYDSSGNEIGDDCSYVYGDGFGGSPGALYNQTINGAHYLIQEEFSNADFATKPAKACIQQEELPTIKFKAKDKRLTTPATFNAKAKDSDGAIVSYAWNFGDGSPSGSGMGVTHSYAAAGTYTVTLVVTDNQGWRNSVSQLLTVP